MAAASRSGATSVASIDGDTSTATMTVARSRGTRTSSVGRAKPTTSSASMARNRPAGTCRRQAGPVRRDPVEQPQVGEPHRVPAAPPLQHHVGDGERGDADQQPQPPRALRMSCRAPPAAAGAAAASRRWAQHVPHDVGDPVAVGPQRKVAGAGTADRGPRRPPAAAARGGGVPLAQPAARRSTPRAAGPVSGSTSVISPTSGSSSSRGSVDLDGEHLVPGGRAGAARRAQSGPSSRKSETTTTRPRRRTAAARPATVGASAGARSAAGAAPWSPCRPRGTSSSVRSTPEQVRAAGARRKRAADPVAAQHVRAEPVAGAGGEEADRRDRGHRQLPLLDLGGAEVHARRRVDQHPGGQLAVRVDLADVRHGGAGGHRPVHPADLVLARPVLPAARELRPRTRQQAEVLALQQAVEPAGDGQLQPAQPPLGRELPSIVSAAPGHAAARSDAPRRCPAITRRRDRPEQPLHDGLGRDPVGDRVERQHQPVRDHVDGQVA